jgi:hypothetical protein
MMSHYRASSGYGVFNCPVLVRINGPLDVPALRAAVDRLGARHQSLRTTFHGRGRDMFQRVHEPRPTPWTYADLSDPDADADVAIAAELRSEVDIRQWPVRATLWRVGPTEHVLCINLHHIVTDAWSTAILFRELHTGYAGAPLDPVGWQYPDFAAWQQNLLDSPEINRHRAYWRRQLRGSALPRLPHRRQSESTPSFGDTGVAAVDLDPETGARLRALAREHRATPFAVLLAAYFAALRQVTGQHDLTVASLFANRTQRETQGTVGFLANMVMLRCRSTPSSTFLDLVREAQTTSIGALAHQAHPFQTLPPYLVETDGLRPDDVVFQVVTETAHRVRAGAAEFELLVPDGIGSRFSFELAVTPLGEGYRAILFYRRDWFDDAFAEGFAVGFGDVVGTAVADPRTPLRTIA